MAWTAGLILGLFFVTSGVTKKEAKESLAKSIIGFTLRTWLAKWPVEFIKLFDSIFSNKHFSIRCFLMSTAFSISGFLAILLIYNHFSCVVPYWGPYSIRGIPNLVFVVVTAVLVINCIPDYLSLLETRKLIGWMAIRNKPLSLVSFLILDLFFSTLIFFTISTLMIFLFMAIHGLYSGDLYNVKISFKGLIQGLYIILTDLLYRVFDIGQPQIPPDGLTQLSLMSRGIDYDQAQKMLFRSFFLTTFLTSVWVWLFSIILITIKCSQQYAVRAWDFLFGKFLDIENQPIRSIGWVGAGLVIIGFTIFSPFYFFLIK